MIPRQFDEVSLTDLERLIANKVAEHRTLEFKRELPGHADKARKDFLADVSSFANAQGGDIIFGIAAVKGVAAEIRGLDAEDYDGELLRWDDILLSGIEPRLPGVRLRWIDCGDEGKVMLIRVPASSIAPHRVVFSHFNQFFGRKTNGKYAMDTYELREAFTASEALPRRLRALHLEAVDAENRGDLPVGLGNEPRAILSLIPLTLFRENRDLEITPDNALAPRMRAGRMETIRMIEGVLLYSIPSEPGASHSYAITHRQGRIDAVWTIGGTINEMRKTELKIVRPTEFEHGVVDAAVSGVTRLAPFAVEGPWLVMVTITGIRGYHLPVNGSFLSEPAWRNEVTLPPLMIETMHRDELAPLLCAFWRAFGLERPAQAARE